MTSQSGAYVPCGNPAPEGGVRCTRPKEHEGEHRVALAGGYRHEWPASAPSEPQP